MASTAKSKLITSPKRRKSLQRRRSRRQHRRYNESLDVSKSSSLSGYFTSESEEVGPLKRSESSSEVSVTSEEVGSETDTSSEVSVPSEDPKLPILRQWPIIPIQLIEKRYYSDSRCKCCRELAKLKLEPQPDDNEYASSDEDFYGDEELRLRVIHHRRERWMTGCFDVGCYPNLPNFGGVYHRDHLRIRCRFPKFDRLMKVCIKLVFKQYREVEEKKELVFLRYLNATGKRGGQVLLFFLTFECYNPLAENYVDICQAMVTIYMHGLKKPQVNLFRRITNDDEDEDLLPVNGQHVSCTKGRRPRRLDTWRDVHHQKGLF